MIEAFFSGSEQSQKLDLDLLSNFSNFDFEIANEDLGHNQSRKLTHQNLAALEKLKHENLDSKVD
jgi:hypothetical protein